MNWTPLKPGDIVDVIAPASLASAEEIRKGLEYLEGLGLVPRIPDDLLKKDFVFANTAEYRFNHLEKSLNAPDSKAVWCLRGGSGCIHLLPMLETATKADKPKLFIGLSDITALHLFLNQRWGWATLHAPILARIGTHHSPDEEKREIEAVLFGRQKDIVFRLKPLNDAAKRESDVVGPVLGGNLTVAHATLGSPRSIKGDGAIIFFEDVGERGYRVDRTLESIRQAGIFEKAKAVVFGDFVGGAEVDGKSFVQEALQRFANVLEIPVLGGLESGHGSLQRPLPLNTTSVLTTGSSPQLRCSL